MQHKFTKLHRSIQFSSEILFSWFYTKNRTNNMPWLMNDILNIQMDETLFLNDICECFMFNTQKLHHDVCTDSVKM
jgi:hypothetical protein